MPETKNEPVATVDLTPYLTIADGRVMRGWVNFNGTGTIAINDSYNVSSIVDNGTGDYTINWDTDFANANYSAIGAALGAGKLVSIIAIAAATLQIGVYTASTGSNTDVAVVSVISIGDQ